MHTTDQFAIPPMRIVIVDDDPDTCTLLAQILEGLNQEVATFANAESVWMYHSLDEVDLFLLDIGLPGLDGIALGRSLRATPNGRRAMVIAVSGGSHHGETQALSAGFDDYFLKPLNLARLKSLLVQASARKQQASPACRQH